MPAQPVNQSTPDAASPTYLQFNRRIRLQVDSLVVQDLRVKFKIKKTDKTEPNTAEISIFNLAKSTRTQMATRYAAVVLSAGYLNNLSVLWHGDARTIDHLKGGESGTAPDWETKIRCGDGERKYLFQGYSKSFGPGATVADVLRDIASNFGLDVGNAIQRAGGKLAMQTFPRGITLHGKASDALNRVARAAGLTFSIQDGGLQLLADAETLARSDLILTPTSGLIGSPDHSTPTKKGDPTMLKVKCLLRADIRPGTPIKVQSANVNGRFKVRVVEHEGDTHGGAWYSHIQATPL